MRRFRTIAAAACVAAACSEEVRPDEAASSNGETGNPGTTSGTPPPSSGGNHDDDEGSSSGSGSSSADPPLVFDVGDDDPSSICKVGDGDNAPLPCDEQAPAGSFEPDIQWTYEADGASASTVIPLVANLTDDNDDGAIDLCDTPDIILVAGTDPIAAINSLANIVVLDGATGEEHFRMSQLVSGASTPALGDLDGDGLPEVVAMRTDGTVVIFEHDGTLAHEKPTSWPIMIGGTTLHTNYGAAFALGDVDNDGDVEIAAADLLFDHEGNTLQTFAEGATAHSATALVDLDDDGDLEIVLGPAAVHHDGSPLWNTGIEPGHVAVADFDDDGRPEVMLTSDSGISLIEHDGTVTYQGLTPTGDPPGSWRRPGAAHDFDGDGIPDFATSSASHYSAYRADASILWTADITDISGIAAGTAFDFLGDGDAEAMYADEYLLYVFDGSDGTVLLQTPRSSGTLIEYPVVADIDNDGSAEILVVSNAGLQPTLSVVRDAQDRWVPARRIWNQHTYHVTNVREDGTIPTHETPHWTALDTFRTQAQLSGDGAACDPAG